MGKLFGTDGVRGVAGKDLTCELALQIGRATAAELTSLDGHRPRILIGKDTRVSGDMLECTLAAGLCSVGADVDLLGVIPTPGVAYLVRKYGADAGIVISASHNPMEFNGIKIFKGDGYKLPDEVENRIEAHIFKNCEDIKICDGAEIGRVHRLDTAVDDYVDALEQHIDADLSGLNVLFDCANGASAKVAQKLFPRLGCQCSFTMASTAAEISTNNHSGSSRTPRVRVVKGGRYGLSKARQFARTAGTVLVIAIFFGLFASIVASQARITQLSGEIDDAKSELTNAQSYNDYLSTTMDQITNSTSVQQEAEDRLGLVKMDPSQVTYVRLEDESVIERAAGTADKFFAGIKTAALSLLGSFDP